MYAPVNARECVMEWISAWNSHQIDSILPLYADDVQFTSPIIMRAMNKPSGTIAGKDKLRLHFENTLKNFPDLHFELKEIFEGVDSIVVHYRSIKNLMASEVRFFNEQGKISRVVFHYSMAAI